MTDNRLFVPRHVDEPVPVASTGAVALIAVAVMFAAFIALNMIHSDHTLSDSAPPSTAYIECTTAEMNAAFAEGRESNITKCTPQMPWYAAHPGWYALAIGGAVFVAGRMWLFMRRMEQARGG